MCLTLSSSQRQKKKKKMVATNLKAETMDLMEKRTAMEAEMNAIIDRLCQPGGPGLSGNLLDSEVSFLFLHHLFFFLSKTKKKKKLGIYFSVFALVNISRAFLAQILTSQSCDQNAIVLPVIAYNHSLSSFAYIPVYFFEEFNRTFT